MKKVKTIIMLLFMLILISPSSIKAATSGSGVGTDLSLYQCTSNYQDNIISTNKDAYFSHCMQATCEKNKYNITYYSPNTVNCVNGNRTPYYSIHKSGCANYQGSVCNNGEIRYCSIVMYYDCSRITNGDKYEVTTTTSTTKASYSKTTTTTVAPSNTKLKSLTFSKGSISFSPDTYTYDLTIDSIITSVSVNAVPEDSSSTVAVDGNKNLENGSVITIVVTGTDGTKSEYKVNIIKNVVTQLSNNTRLKTLEVANYTINFTPRTTTYSLTINEGVTELSIDAKSEEDSSIVMINGNENLKNGSKITISVTAEDGSVGYYYININVKKRSNFIKILFIIIIILVLAAGGFYIYKKIVSGKDGDKYEYE